MSDFDNKRNWLLIIAIAAMVVLLWDSGPNLFHFHWNVPFWPIVIVLFAIWWMSGGKHRAGGCDCGSEECCQDDAELNDAEQDSAASYSDEEDEESANKA